MKIAIASDHAGFKLKRQLLDSLEAEGHEILDLGTDSEEPVDYPDYAVKVAKALISGGAEKGIFICGSGVGGSVAANKIPGIRAGLCHDTYSAHQSVEHDDVNLLCLGARIVGVALSLEIVNAFINARFSSEDRHQRRLNKVLEIENYYFRQRKSP